MHILLLTALEFNHDINFLPSHYEVFHVTLGGGICFGTIISLLFDFINDSIITLISMYSMFYHFYND